MIRAMAALLERRTAARRRAIVAGAAVLGVDAMVEGEAVRLSAPGLAARWMDDPAIRELGRSGR